MQNWIQRCVFVGLFGALAGGSWGQATLVDAPDTIYVALDTLSGSGAVEAHWTVANNTDSPLSLMVTRNFIDTVSPFNYPYQSGEPGAFERFCWGPTCFNYGTDSSPANAAFFVNLNSGLSDDSFRSDYYPNGVVGSTTLEYCFTKKGRWPSVRVTRSRLCRWPRPPLLRYVASRLPFNGCRPTLRRII